MKRLRLPRAIAALGAVALLSSGCTLLSVPNEVSVGKIPVDLTFGGNKAPETEVIPPPPVPVLPTDLPTLPPGPEPGPPKPPPPPLCGPTTAIAPRDAAVASIGFDNQPRQGPYLFGYVGNFENQPPFPDLGNRTVESVEATDTDFVFTISDAFTQAKWAFRVEPLTETNAETAGLYLARLELPDDPTSPTPRLLPFEPAAPLKMTGFPIQAGTTTTAAAIDVAPKSTTPIDNPLTGGPLLSPSGNAIQSSMTAGSPERFPACEELAHAYKTNWKIEITGEYTVTILGSFWLATQYGGWPIRDDYVVSGDLMAGNFSSTMFKIDPKEWL